MMQPERDTVTEVLQLVVTVDANIQDCISHEEWLQEIMYAINHAAAEKFPVQAKEKGFYIGVEITTITKTRCECPLGEKVCAFHEDGTCNCE